MSFHFHGPLDPDSPLFQKRDGFSYEAGQEIEDLSNYVVNACLSDARSFAKRYYAIYSSRQSGKTSLLLDIQQRVKVAGGYACWIDFQWAYGAAPEPSINFMAQQIVAAIPELEASVKVPDKFDHDGFGFDKWLKKLPVPEKKPFVLLIEELGALPLESRLRLGLLLRGAFNGRFNTPWKHVVLVFLGGIELNDMITVEVSPLFNICENIDLLDLRSTATQSLLTSGFEQDGDFKSGDLGLDKLVQNIHAQVSGHPYLTQFLGGHALTHFNQKGALPVDIQTMLAPLRMENSKYIEYLYQSIQKYDLLDVMKTLLQIKHHPNEKAIRRLGLLGVLAQKPKTDPSFRNKLIQDSLEKILVSNQQQSPQITLSDNLNNIEEETHLIREAKVQSLLERVFKLTCMQSPESLRNILTKLGIVVESEIDLNGSSVEVITKLFYFLDNLPRAKNGCHPLGLFLTIIKGLSREEKETIRVIDAFIALYGLMESKSAIFVSYAWGGESERMVNELELAFAKRGLSIVRDKKEINYKDSIKEFEQRIGRGQFIILVISDKYLRSEHCMLELVEIAEHQEFRKRIFPIVLDDAQIYKSVGRLAYIKYWDKEISQLNDALIELGRLPNTAGFTSDLNKYVRIRTKFDDLTFLLSDMNTLAPEMLAADDFDALISVVEAGQALTP